jgi:hypothetical protein
MEVSGEHHTSVAVSRGKGPRHPLMRRLGGPHNWSGRFVASVGNGIEFLYHPTHSIVTVRTELWRLTLKYVDFTFGPFRFTLQLDSRRK